MKNIKNINTNLPPSFFFHIYFSFYSFTDFFHSFFNQQQSSIQFIPIMARNDTEADLGEVRHEIDLASLETYLSTGFPNDFTAPFVLKQFGFGQSNPSYQLKTLRDANTCCERSHLDSLYRRLHTPWTVSSTCCGHSRNTQAYLFPELLSLPG